jgi:hypothetical protein
MTRCLFIWSLAGSLIATVACNRSSVTMSPRAEEHYVSAPGSVGFDIEPLPGGGTAPQQWLATYTSQGKTAKFRIELSVSKPLGDTDSRRFSIESGDGRFIAEPGSDASVLLADLQKALEARSIPAKVRREGSLPFQFVSFGRNQSQASGGGFNADPPGHWTPMKIFIGEREQEGEVFLNLNPVIKKGEFSIKDPDYGDMVLAQLARVL